jgi:hypothetical protein
MLEEDTDSKASGLYYCGNHAIMSTRAPAYMDNNWQHIYQKADLMK